MFIFVSKGNKYTDSVSEVARLVVACLTVAETHAAAARQNRVTHRF